MKQIGRIITVGLCASLLMACAGSHRSAATTNATTDQGTTSQGLGDASGLGGSSDIVARGGDRNAVYFALNKYDVTPEYQNVVDRFASYLNKHADAKVKIAGYTDKSGSRSWNLSLSQMRAKSVASALMAEGVKSSQIQTIGYGEEYRLAICANKIICWQERRAAISPTE